MSDRKGGDHSSSLENSYNHHEKHSRPAATTSSAMAPPAGTARLRRAASSDDRVGSGAFGSGSSYGNNSFGSSTSLNDAPPPLRRRSSNFSDYSHEARDILNPTAPDALREDDQQGSGWESLPLAFALLPALGGLLVQGGSAFMTDLMLLALGAIFLHWSVTQPWSWYRSAQQVREDHQESTEYAVDSYSDYDDEADDEIDEITEEEITSSQPLADVPEEEEGPEKKTVGKKEQEAGQPSSTAAANTDAGSPPPAKDTAALLKQKRLEQRQAKRRQYQARHDAALRELYRHEVLALLSCFVSPILGAYLLHALRDQLTRPSEGLISNYNLSIFLLGAEIRPLRHLIQLVQARTLHLQRIVHANPYRDEEEAYRERRADEERTQNQTLSGLVARLESLEAAKGTRAAPEDPAASPTSPTSTIASIASSSSPVASKREGQRDREQLLRDLRATIQPDLDTLARALRRTHKQQTLLEGQLAARFRATDQRLNDAVAVATAATIAAQQQRNRRSLGSAVDAVVGTAVGTTAWTVERVLAVVLFVPRLVVGQLLFGRLPSPLGSRGKGLGDDGGFASARSSSNFASTTILSYSERPNGKRTSSTTNGTNGASSSSMAEASNIGSRRAASPDTASSARAGKAPAATIQQGKVYRTSAKR